MPAPELVVAVALLWNEAGRLLCVRKRNSTTFILPGGKIAPGEHSLETVMRELQEELELTVTSEELTFLGRYRAPAANEPGHWVVADAYVGPLVKVTRVCAELEALRWVDPRQALEDESLALLLRTRILPAWLTR